MRLLDICSALVVIIVWGLNFIVIKSGVDEIPPLLLGALRFTLAAIPMVLLLPPPKVPLRLYLAYGLTISVGQFAFLFVAIHIGMPSGMASLVLQSQVFFTMLLAAFWLKEAWHGHQLAGLILAASGLIIIASTHGTNMPLIGFVCTLMAALMWASGNIVTRMIATHGPINQLAFVAWASLVPPLPFLGMSLVFEGQSAIERALENISLHGLSVIAYLAWAATLLGYGLWTRLLTRYPANLVAPFSLLVPVIGLSAGWLIYAEELNPANLAGSFLLVLGLVANLFGGRWRTSLRNSS